MRHQIRYLQWHNALKVSYFRGNPSRLQYEASLSTDCQLRDDVFIDLDDATTVSVRGITAMTSASKYSSRRIEFSLDIREILPTVSASNATDADITRKHSTGKVQYRPTLSEIVKITSPSNRYDTKFSSIPEIIQGRTNYYLLRSPQKVFVRRKCHVVEWRIYEQPVMNLQTWLSYISWYKTTGLPRVSRENLAQHRDHFIINSIIIGTIQNAVHILQPKRFMVHHGVTSISARRTR